MVTMDRSATDIVEDRFVGREKNIDDRAKNVGDRENNVGGRRVQRDPVATTNDLRRAGFPFRSGRLCLDFVATMAKRGLGDRELLARPADLATWLRCADLPAVARISAADLADTIALREATHVLTRAHVAGQRPPLAAIRLVNSAAQAGPPTVTLAADGHTAVPAPRAPVAAILSMLARDAIDLFSGPYAHRIRACRGADCSLYFVDHSRPGSRRWCAMAACGEKASSATYRKRHPNTRPR